jgi:hypothetical protein
MPMTGADLRGRIRKLIEAGVLPKDPPVIQRAGAIAASGLPRDPCAICTEPDPVVTYFWPGGIVGRLGKTQ